MDLLWRILAALSFDCFKSSSSSSSSSSAGKQSSSQPGSLDSSSLTGSLSLGPDAPHCQCCITYEARLKRLSCGHLYCDACCHHIVNLAFRDIEGLSDYPCPMCKSLNQLGGRGASSLSSSGCFCGPHVGRAEPVGWWGRRPAKAPLPGTHLQESLLQNDW
ncbi:RING finger protein 223-like [Hippocampus zosterae]|uniref:RING finger protein 223-like n=1 Tax=Hippocampus zosterae TaxID=109293 RepID=UPI00223E8541|nr:RING finger protein 223-like [Hippocampus zosterae]